MPNITPNLSLIKPTTNEYFDVAHQNTNMDTIDAAINSLQTNQTIISKNTSTIPTTGWVANTGDYPLKYSLAISGIIVGDWVELTIDKEYLDVASAAEICSTIDEYAGGITLYAKTIPTLAIPVRYMVVK